MQTTVIDLGNGLSVALVWSATLGDVVLVLALVGLGGVLVSRWFFDWLANLERDTKPKERA